jgi:hypothetical protein
MRSATRASDGDQAGLLGVGRAARHELSLDGRGGSKLRAAQENTASRPASGHARLPRAVHNGYPTSPRPVNWCTARSRCEELLIANPDG